MKKLVIQIYLKFINDIKISKALIGKQKEDPKYNKKKQLKYQCIHINLGNAGVEEHSV